MHDDSRNQRHAVQIHPLRVGLPPAAEVQEAMVRWRHGQLAKAPDAGAVNLVQIEFEAAFLLELGQSLAAARPMALIVNLHRRASRHLVE